jgi:hypothetical protein
MTTAITGRCFCGSVRFRFTQAPVARRACWCRDCQYLAAGNATINLIFRAEACEAEGEVAAYVSMADSGNVMRRSFCPRCGTPLFAASLETPDYMVVRVGALDDREIGKPDSVIWTGSAPSWGLVDMGGAACAGQPAPVGKS